MAIAPPPAATADATAADLFYVSDDLPGITRHRVGRGFAYRTAAGELIRDADMRAWIRALAISPAWSDVWICPDASGHVLATGRDARGRKQYRYHPAWRMICDATKFDRMLAFGHALPSLRERVDDDLSLTKLPREKVLAAVLRLIDATLLRVGNDEYARLNDSFGATTMRGEHVHVDGATVRFAFRGKHRKPLTGRITDRRLARIVRRCQDLAGEVLSNTPTQPASRAASIRRTSTPTCARSPAGTSRSRTSAPGEAQLSPRACSERSGRVPRRRR